MGFFPSLQTIGMGNGILFLLPFLQYLKFSTRFLQQTLGANSLSWLISRFESKLLAISLLHKISDFCLTVRKNHITADITEHVRIILILVIYSYSNTNIKLKREKINQQSVSSTLTIDTVH